MSHDESAVTSADDPGRSSRWVTIPNILCAVRLVGAFVLAALAIAERTDAFLWLYVFLAATDWVDGKLAVLLNQRSIIGARLDSWADAALYSGLLFGSLWMYGRLLQGEWIWITAAVSSYAVSVAAAYAKFGRWPSYHTRMAKTSWLLITIGAISLLGGWSLWPLRIALLTVTLTNVEHLIITRISAHGIADAGSLLKVLRSRRTATTQR